MENCIKAEQTTSETYKAVSIISRKYGAQFWDSLIASERTFQEVKDLQSVFLSLHFSNQNVEAIRLLHMVYGMLKKPYPDELKTIGKYPVIAECFMNAFLLDANRLLYLYGKWYQLICD